MLVKAVLSINLVVFFSLFSVTKFYPFYLAVAGVEICLNVNIFSFGGISSNVFVLHCRYHWKLGASCLSCIILPCWVDIFCKLSVWLFPNLFQMQMKLNLKFLDEPCLK